MAELILGIDDAGRGPVIGPMILTGCLIKKESEKELKKLGVKDSKIITPKRREFLKEKIEKIHIKSKTITIFPKEIDSSQDSGLKLNELEADKIAQIINELNEGKERIKVIIDCPSVSISKWGDYLKTKINNLENLEIYCEHKADKNHLAVSSASILAKFKREEEMDKLKKEYGEEIGSGYTSDQLTIKFLERNAIKYKDKGIFRKSWITYQKAKDKLMQEKLNY